jgi:hypothetical protein
VRVVSRGVGVVTVMALIARERVEQLAEDRGADHAESDYDYRGDHASIVRLAGSPGKDRCKDPDLHRSTFDRGQLRCHGRTG